ncbi:hypothetical protein ACFL2V_06530 [Pseudomonadota bacterium]
MKLGRDNLDSVMDDTPTAPMAELKTESTIDNAVNAVRKVIGKLSEGNRDQVESWCDALEEYLTRRILPLDELFIIVSGNPNDECILGEALSAAELAEAEEDAGERTGIRRTTARKVLKVAVGQ